MKSILVVDDDALDSTIIVASLKSACDSAVITVVNTSSEAAARFREIKPDLTLLDISMPGLDGFDVLQTLNSCPEREGRTVVMLSGSPSPRDRSRAKALGADDYRVKPSGLDAYRALAEDLVTAGYATDFPGRSSEASICLHSTTALFIDRLRRAWTVRLNHHPLPAPHPTWC